MRQFASRRRPRRTVQISVVLAALVLPLQALGGAQVPFKGSDSGSFVLGPGPCPAGYVPLDINGSGNASHLGKYTVHADECFDGVATFFGVLRMTAANGDMIFATYSGTVPPDLSGYTETALVTGGTGRFSGAEGELDVIGVISGPDSYSQTLSGSVSAPGS